jgi:hypothetical protein
MWSERGIVARDSKPALRDAGPITRYPTYSYVTIFEQTRRTPFGWLRVWVCALRRNKTNKTPTMDVTQSRTGKPPAAIRSIIEKRGGPSLQPRNKKHQLVLHVATANENLPLEVIWVLVESLPRAVREKDCMAPVGVAALSAPTAKVFPAAGKAAARTRARCLFVPRQGATKSRGTAPASLGHLQPHWSQFRTKYLYK